MAAGCLTCGVSLSFHPSRTHLVIEEGLGEIEREGKEREEALAKRKDFLVVLKRGRLLFKSVVKAEVLTKSSAPVHKLFSGH